MNPAPRPRVRAGNALVAIVLATGAVVGSLGGNACNKPWCGESAAAACAATDRCEPTYDAASAAVCHGCGFGESVGVGMCDGLRVIVCNNTDVLSATYYAADGTIAAIVEGGSVSRSFECRGGGSSFTATEPCLLDLVAQGPVCTVGVGSDGGAVSDATSD